MSAHSRASSTGGGRIVTQNNALLAMLRERTNELRDQQENTETVTRDISPAEQTEERNQSNTPTISQSSPSFSGKAERQERERQSAASSKQEPRRAYVESPTFTKEDEETFKFVNPDVSAELHDSLEEEEGSDIVKEPDSVDLMPSVTQLAKATSELAESNSRPQTHTSQTTPPKSNAHRSTPSHKATPSPPLSPIAEMPNNKKKVFEDRNYTVHDCSHGKQPGASRSAASDLTPRSDPFQKLSELAAKRYHTVEGEYVTRAVQPIESPLKPIPDDWAAEQQLLEEEQRYQLQLQQRIAHAREAGEAVHIPRLDLGEVVSDDDDEKRAKQPRHELQGLSEYEQLHQLRDSLEPSQLALLPADAYGPAAEEVASPPEITAPQRHPAHAQSAADAAPDTYQLQVKFRELEARLAQLEADKAATLHHTGAAPHHTSSASAPPPGGAKAAGFSLAPRPGDARYHQQQPDPRLQQIFESSRSSARRMTSSDLKNLQNPGIQQQYMQDYEYIPEEEQGDQGGYDHTLQPYDPAYKPPPKRGGAPQAPSKPVYKGNMPLTFGSRAEEEEEDEERDYAPPRPQPQQAYAREPQQAYARGPKQAPTAPQQAPTAPQQAFVHRQAPPQAYANGQPQSYANAQAYANEYSNAHYDNEQYANEHNGVGQVSYYDSPPQQGQPQYVGAGYAEGGVPIQQMRQPMPTGPHPQHPTAYTDEDPYAPNGQYIDPASSHYAQPGYEGYSDGAAPPPHVSALPTGLRSAPEPASTDYIELNKRAIREEVKSASTYHKRFHRRKEAEETTPVPAVHRKKGKGSLATTQNSQRPPLLPEDGAGDSGGGAESGEQSTTEQLWAQRAKSLATSKERKLAGQQSVSNNKPGVRKQGTFRVDTQGRSAASTANGGPPQGAGGVVVGASSTHTQQQQQLDGYGRHEVEGGARLAVDYRVVTGEEHAQQQPAFTTVGALSQQNIAAAYGGAAGQRGGAVGRGGGVEQLQLQSVTTSASSAGHGENHPRYHHPPPPRQPPAPPYQQFPPTTTQQPGGLPRQPEGAQHVAPPPPHPAPRYPHTHPASLRAATHGKPPGGFTRYGGTKTGAQPVHAAYAQPGQAEYTQHAQGYNQQQQPNSQWQDVSARSNKSLQNSSHTVPNYSSNHKEGDYYDQYDIPESQQNISGMSSPTSYRGGQSPSMSPYRVVPPISSAERQDHSKQGSYHHSRKTSPGRVADFSAPPGEGGGSYMEQLKNKKREVQYKQYTLKDYRSLHKEVRLGGLGPNTESETVKEKKEKLQRQLNYARSINDRNRQDLEVPRKPRSQPVSEAEAEDDMMDRRKLALEYAKSVPKPKLKPQRDEEEDQIAEQRNPKYKYVKGRNSLKTLTTMHDDGFGNYVPPTEYQLQPLEPSPWQAQYRGSEANTNTAKTTTTMRLGQPQQPQQQQSGPGSQPQAATHTGTTRQQGYDFDLDELQRRHEADKEKVQFIRQNIQGSVAS